MSKARLFRAARPGDRKKYFRKKGLAGGQFVAEQVEARLKRCAAVSQLQGWLGMGVGEIVGKLCYLTYYPDLEAAVEERLRKLRCDGKLFVCKTATGAVCQSPGWALVKVNGVTIDVRKRAEQEATQPQMDADGRG